MRADVACDSGEAMARVFDGCADRGGDERRGAVACDRGGDAVERARIRLHEVVAAGAVDVHVDESRNYRHARGDVVGGAGRNAHFVAVAESGDAAVFDDDHAVADFVVGRKDAASVYGGSGHRLSLRRADENATRSGRRNYSIALRGVACPLQSLGT